MWDWDPNPCCIRTACGPTPDATTREAEGFRQVAGESNSVDMVVPL